MTRFITENDTPCPFRLGRMGFVQTGEFRAPEKDELFILPTDSEPLGENEPQVSVADPENVESHRTPRHIVVAISEQAQKEIAEYGPFIGMFASEEVRNELIAAQRAAIEAQEAQD